MYNDYYLQEISGKLSVTNNNLSTIISNQSTILINQQSIINNQNLIINSIKFSFLWLLCFLVAFMFYYHIHNVISHK